MQKAYPTKNTKILKKLLLMVTILLTSFAVSNAYGHGLSSETMPPVLLGNRNVTLAISETQLTPDSAQSSKIIAIMLYDTNTKKPVPDVTFHVNVSKEDTQLFDSTFQRHDGDLDLNIVTTNSKEVTIKEEGGVGWFGSLTGSKNNAAIVTGPIFGSGGLYRFKIEILTADSYSNKLNPPIIYDVKISIPDTKSYKVFDSSNSEQTIGVITYYEQIQNFNYDASSKSISFLMPFDWSDQNINQVSVVHEEIRIPRSFGDFLVTKYEAYVNSLPISSATINVDDYSSDDRIIHLILSKTDLQDLAKMDKNTKQNMEFTLKPSTESGFPLTGLTRNMQYKVSLSWDPEKITSGSSTKFYFKVLDPNLINKTVPSLGYDFSLVQNHQVVFRKSGTTTDSQTEENMVEIQIPDVSGPIAIVFENLGGNSFAGTEFSSIVTKPTVSNPKFPIQLTSFSLNGDSKMSGKYIVDLTWFPSNISIDEEAEFVFTIKDKQTGIPVSSSTYDLVILQRGNEVYRKSGIAPNGGDFVDYTFSNGQDGQTVLRIENINGSGEAVEIPFAVTPEFPIALQIMVIAVIFIIAFHRIKSIKN